jgi:hypothetical protein
MERVTAAECASHPVTDREVVPTLAGRRRRLLAGQWCLAVFRL